MAKKLKDPEIDAMKKMRALMMSLDPEARMRAMGFVARSVIETLPEAGRKAAADHLRSWLA